jgi:hypothetical protein
MLPRKCMEFDPRLDVQSKVCRPSQRHAAISTVARHIQSRCWHVCVDLTHYVCITVKMCWWMKDNTMKSLEEDKRRQRGSNELGMCWILRRKMGLNW